MTRRGQDAHRHGIQGVLEKCIDLLSTIPQFYITTIHDLTVLLCCAALISHLDQSFLTGQLRGLQAVEMDKEIPVYHFGVYSASAT